MSGTKIKKTILWVDDEVFHTTLLADLLEIEGFRVMKARLASEAMVILKKQARTVNLVILDVMMPEDPTFDRIASQGGFRTGLLLGRWIKEHYPTIPILGYSIDAAPEIIEWFDRYASGFLSKKTTKWDLIEQVRRRFGMARPPRVFIVHGHDTELKLELKNFIQNTLRLGEPIILHERENFGRTIIEKFEEESEGVDIVFVLLTPDD